MHTLAIFSAGSHLRVHAYRYPKLAILYAGRNRVLYPTLPICANSGTHQRKRK